MIPNAYAKRPTFFGTFDENTTLMHGMVLIAAKSLSKGEELVMDYRLNPKAGKLPEWYHTYSNEEIETRWGGKTVME